MEIHFIRHCWFRWLKSSFVESKNIHKIIEDKIFTRRGLVPGRMNIKVPEFIVLRQIRTKI